MKNSERMDMVRERINEMDFEDLVTIKEEITEAVQQQIVKKLNEALDMADEAGMRITYNNDSASYLYECDIYDGEIVYSVREE